MQLDIGSESTLRFALDMHGSTHRQTDKQKVTHMSLPCKVHRWAQKANLNP